MSFDTRELSVQDGQPIELYEFSFGAFVMRFTSANQDVVFATQTYKSASLSHDEIEETTDVPRNDITITSDHDFDVAKLMSPYPPSDIIDVVIFATHAGDTDRSVVWMGRVLNCEWLGISAQLSCENDMTSFDRMGLNRKYQKNCPYALFDEDCTVSQTLHQVTATITGFVGLTISAAAFASYAANRFAGGWIEWEREPGRIERRDIATHSGADITIQYPLPGLPVGAQITAFKGCRHDMADCNDEFGNLPNYGGDPYIPDDTPYNGADIF